MIQLIVCELHDMILFVLVQINSFLFHTMSCHSCVCLE